MSSSRINLPTIEIFRKSLQKSPLTRKRKNIIAVTGDKPPDKEHWPYFKEDDVVGLVNLAEKKVLKAARAQAGTELIVNGRRVPMLPFVKDIIENAVRGMVVSLKGCENPQDIKLTIIG